MNPWAKFAPHAQRFWGPKARKRVEKLRVFRNRAIRRLERKRGPRAERLPARVASGYPGAVVFNRRGRNMGPGAKESTEVRAARRARGIGMKRPRVANPPTGR